MLRRPPAALIAAAAATAATAATGASAAARRPVVAVDRVPVPGGAFVQGSTHGDEDERPVRSTALPAFAIDRTEVTRGAYAACVAARRCKRVPPELGAGADGDDDARLPVVGVSWFDAQDFCRFAGGRLPTEAEWERAARGTDGRELPWGGEPLCDRANWGNDGGDGPCVGQNPGRPVAVGSYAAGVSPAGALDMAGNVWEWVADRYDEDPTRRVVRGGSCSSTLSPPRSANRNAWAPSFRDRDLGFRCVTR